MQRGRGRQQQHSNTYGRGKQAMGQNVDVDANDTHNSNNQDLAWPNSKVIQRNVTTTTTTSGLTDTTWQIGTTPEPVLNRTRHMYGTPQKLTLLVEVQKTNTKYVTTTEDTISIYMKGRVISAK